ncbi:ras-related and estrogen-regulated growth inhibitor isoform X3 [Carassius gibelio]|uniref:ras-related and estrogen-regulated growth inhibitor isoform X3 n=1 Tax=Carassius gibelio TaxID=101364 RepID=UPI00227856A6|nr:ras-related and estrogen-regulated growth inhibitor isoform X3 [Carassius gibelio]
MIMSESVRKMLRAKLVVLGRDNCGKTALCVRFITRRFIGEYEHKREVTYRCQKIVDKEAIELEILDTVNKECVGPAASSLESSIKWGDGFLIMYSVTDRSSFEAVSRLKRLIDHVKQTLGIPAVIVANKCDMENGRVVRTDEGQALASDLSQGLTGGAGAVSLSCLWQRTLRQWRPRARSSCVRCVRSSSATCWLWTSAHGCCR